MDMMLLASDIVKAFQWPLPDGEAIKVSWINESDFLGGRDAVMFRFQSPTIKDQRFRVYNRDIYRAVALQERIDVFAREIVSRYIDARDAISAYLSRPCVEANHG